MLLVFIIILGLLFLAIGSFFVFLTDATFGGLDFRTEQGTIDEVIKLIKLKGLENSNFYDLGSCRGGLAISISKALPKIKVIGIDNSRFRVLLSNTKAIFLKNLTFKKENIFNSDISAANIIFLYLPQELMSALETKLQKELKHGGLVISNRVSFPTWQADEKVNQLSIYVKN